MKIKKINENVIRQLSLILLIAFLGIVIVDSLSYFIPGALGAITLYILFRKTFFRLTEERGWKKSLTSLFLILVSLILLVGPIWILVEVLIPQVKNVLENKEIITQKFNAVKTFLQSKPLLNRINLSEEGMMKYLQKITTYIPAILNSIAGIFANLFTAFFILYFMQVSAKNMERKVKLFMPLSQENTQSLWDETNMMVRSNALGIPILALCQGIVAAIGYWIFGVNNPLLWGLITGAASVVPAVGTMIVWVPICIIQFATTSIGSSIALTLYCLIIVGGIDNVLRFTILKKIGDVPPLITVFGVILGLKLFGVMGLIFGPLLLSYFSLLLKVYRTEFSKKQELMAAIEESKPEEVVVTNFPPGLGEQKPEQPEQ